MIGRPRLIPIYLLIALNDEVISGGNPVHHGFDAINPIAIDALTLFLFSWPMKTCQVVHFLKLLIKI